MDFKISPQMKMVMGMAKGFIPALPKKNLGVIASPKYNLSKVIIEALNTHKKELKEVSTDLYEIIQNLSMHFVITYETDETTRKTVDQTIDKIIEAYLEKRKKFSS